MTNTESKDEVKREMTPAPLFSHSLPPAFTEFLSRNSIPLQLFTDAVTLQRFIRLNPRAAINRDSLQSELGAQLDATPLEQFLALDSNVQIADKQSYKNGSIYGMDLASGVSVLALDPQPTDHVLDLCCAPGNKLCLIADFMINKFCETSHSTSTATSAAISSSSSSSNALPRLAENVNLPGSVTGVDWNYQRLAATRSLLRKYQLADQIRLFLCDGQTFHASPPAPLSSYNSKPIWQGQIIDLMNSTKASSAAANGVASTEGFHCASALTSSILKTADGSMLRLTKREKQAIRKQEAKQAWEEKLKKRKLDEQNSSAVVDSSETATDAPTTAQSLSDDTPSSSATMPSSADASTDVTVSKETTLADVPQFYDRVLVDAECTHDGSFKHITKFYTESTATPSSSTMTAGSEASWQEFETKFLNPARMESLQLLQRNLIWNGFERTKPGGTLVYSTCSYSRRQNEEIIAWLLVKARGSAKAVHVFDGVSTFSKRIVEPQAKKTSTFSSSQMHHQVEELKLSAELSPLRYRLGQLNFTEFIGTLPASDTEQNAFAETILSSSSINQPQLDVSISIEWGIRMDPIVSQTSGLYIAKIQKLR